MKHAARPAVGITLFLLVTSTAASGEFDELVAYLEPRVHALESADDLDPLMERIGSARLVLLGESSHGTSEYYTWRAAITKRLIVEKGFDFVAVEGDWPSCYVVNRYVKGLPDRAKTAKEALRAFQRWPRWMWANEETRELIEWLALHNAKVASDARVGFFGLDLYSLPQSIEAVLDYKQQVKPELAGEARQHYQSLLRFRDDPLAYARHIAQSGSDYSAQAQAVVALLRGHADPLQQQDRKAYFNAKQNALLVKNAERHYRAMVDARMNSWNERVGHMHLTLRRLLAYHGPRSRAIVWAHNTHVGDARATSMIREGMQNIGQLTRQEYGPDEVVLVGFSTHRGTVLAGRSWGASMEAMQVPPAIPGSIEDLFSRLEPSRLLLVFDPRDMESPLRAPRGHRAKGVVYNPQTEARNYVPTVLPQRYDAFMFFDQTSALRAIELP
jgi:erythromycin esterase